MIHLSRLPSTSGTLAALFLTLLAACGDGMPYPDIDASGNKPEGMLIMAGDLPAGYSGEEIPFEGMVAYINKLSTRLNEMLGY